MGRILACLGSEISRSPPTPLLAGRATPHASAPTRLLVWIACLSRVRTPIGSCEPRSGSQLDDRQTPATSSPIWEKVTVPGCCPL